jgi:hypothetical protein
MPVNRSLPLRPLLFWIAAVGLLGGGCVQRRMTIRTNPPGAQVYIDNQEIGRTPVSTDFVYYGRRDIRLVKDGYETLSVKQPVWAPWYEWPGLAFVAENVWPGEIRDERRFDFQMQPAMVVPSQTLLTRAEELRRSQVVTPVATTEIAAPPVTTIAPPAATTIAPTPTGGPYATPPTGGQYVPPPAILNYPPTGVQPQPQLPGDFGGRPVPVMP